ncbi:integrase, partial [Klebsiella pneumoniae]|nr:integrase [Klebsiella pneumoniae]
KLYAADLTELGISHTVLGTIGWLRKQNLAWPDHSALTKQGIKPANPIFYTYKSGLVKYCFRDFSEAYLSVLHT